GCCGKPPGGDGGCCGKPPDCGCGVPYGGDGGYGAPGGCAFHDTACVASGEYFGVGSAGGGCTTCVASEASGWPGGDTSCVESASPGCWGCCAGPTICV